MTGIVAAILIVVLVGSLVVGFIIGWVEGPYRYGDHQAAYWGAGVVWMILAIVLALILAGEI